MNIGAMTVWDSDQKKNVTLMTEAIIAWRLKPEGGWERTEVHLEMMPIINGEVIGGENAEHVD